MSSLIGNGAGCGGSPIVGLTLPRGAYADLPARPEAPGGGAGRRPPGFATAILLVPAGMERWLPPGLGWQPQDPIGLGVFGDQSWVHS